MKTAGEQRYTEVENTYMVLLFWGENLLFLKSLLTEWCFVDKNLHNSFSSYLLVKKNVVVGNPSESANVTLSTSNGFTSHFFLPKGWRKVTVPKHREHVPRDTANVSWERSINHVHRAVWIVLESSPISRKVDHVQSLYSSHSLYSMSWMLFSMQWGWSEEFHFKPWCMLWVWKNKLLLP